MKPLPFTKYDTRGAYHWIECDRHSSQYNPPLEARYDILAGRVGRVQRILDVGCGDGYLMGRVSACGNSVVGIDPAAVGVALAADRLRHFRNCTVVQGSAYNLPFGDGYFDVVLLADVIEHLERPAKSLREMTRVLAPNGTLLVTTPKWRPDRKWDPQHVREYQPEELNTCLKAHFSDVNVTFFWPLNWSAMYTTKVGWRLIRLFSRYVYNPFLQAGCEAERYGQMVAVCRQPYQRGMDGPVASDNTPLNPIAPC